jgi:hypothetical protein
MDSSYFLEIFGSDDPQKPSSAREPVTVLDDPLFAYLPGGNAADALSRQLSDDELVSEISGLEPSEFQKSAQRIITKTEHHGGDAFARSFEAHGGTITKADGRECWTFNGGSCECK